MTHAVYNRMGLLLKSLVTVTRITPAYKLSRRQGQDSYVICYRIFLGDPVEPPDLGEGALTARVGQVATPESTIVCCVDYRKIHIIKKYTLYRFNQYCGSGSKYWKIFLFLWF